MSARFITSLAELPRRPELVIVGSGVVGLSTAFFCSRLGMRPLVIERLPSPASLTSRRSGEGVRAQWELAHNIAIARASIELYANFAELIGDEQYGAGYRPVGYLYASRSAKGAELLAARVARQRAAGLDDVELLDAAAVARRFPLLGDVTAAAIRRRDGTIDISAVLAGYLAGMEADILLGTETGAIQAAPSGVRIDSAAGRIEAGAVVLANGARLAAALRALAAPVAVRVARSSILRLTAEGIPADHPVTIDIDLGSFWRPDAGGARITSSFRGTLFVADDVDDPPPDRDYLAQAIATVQPMTPAWRGWARGIRDSHLRTGTFAVTADGAPLIGPLPDLPGVFVNGGYGGHGVMMSAEGGRRLAAMIAEGREAPGSAFSPARFTGGPPPQPEPMTINMATA